MYVCMCVCVCITGVHTQRHECTHECAYVYLCGCVHVSWHGQACERERSRDRCGEVQHKPSVPRASGAQEGSKAETPEETHVHAVCERAGLHVEHENRRDRLEVDNKGG